MPLTMLGQLIPKVVSRRSRRGTCGCFLGPLHGFHSVHQLHVGCGRRCSDESSVGGCATFNFLPFAQNLSFLGAIIFECVANFGFLLGRQFQMRRELLPILKEISSNSGDVCIANWSI